MSPATPDSFLIVISTQRPQRYTEGRGDNESECNFLCKATPDSVSSRLDAHVNAKGFQLLDYNADTFWRDLLRSLAKRVGNSSQQLADRNDQWPNFRGTT